MRRNIYPKYSIKEIAKGSFNNRNQFSTKDNVDYNYGGTEIHCSVFDHSESIIHYAEANEKSVEGYLGPVRFDYLPIDIDYEDDLEIARQRTIEIIEKLKTDYKVDISQLSIFFSGCKGFHILIPSEMIATDHKPSIQIPKIVSSIVREITNYADHTFYHTTGLLRVPYTKNSKSGLFKIGLKYEQLCKLSIEQIQDLAKEPRFYENEKVLVNVQLSEGLNNLFNKYQEKYGDSFEDSSSESVYNSELPKLEIKAFDKIVESCSYFRDLIESAAKGENLKHNQRLALAKLLLKFGEDGRAKVHEILHNTPNYSRERTESHLNSLTKRDKAPVPCEVLCDGNVCETIQLLNKRSCYALAFIEKTEKFLETHIAEKFVATRKDILYSIVEDNFYQYKNGVYSIIDEKELASLLRAFALMYTNKYKVTAKAIKALVERLKMEKDIQIKEKMNTNGTLINLQNGFYDLTSNQLKAHTPSVFTSIQLNFSYDNNATAPRFEKYLKEVLIEEDKIEYVLNTMCYLLIPNYSYQKVFILYGSGRNGKSILTSVISNLVGMKNVSSISIHDIAQNRFSLVNLKDKLINISSEIGSKDLETEMLKKLSGNDIIYADRKYKDGLSFVNAARLLINANELPRFSELNDAILERFVLIKFPRTFRDEEVNTNLLIELLSELPGIFNLVISRFDKIQSGVGGGGIYYPIPKSIQEERGILLSEISSAAEFIDEECVRHPEIKIKLSKLFSEYEKFCVMNGYKALGSKNFKKAIYSAYNLEFMRENDGWWIEGITSKKIMKELNTSS